MATTGVKDNFNGGSDNGMKVNADGSINVDISGGSGDPVNTDLTEVGGAAITLGQTLESASFPVTIASDQTPMISSAANITSIASSASNVTLLPSNPNRKGAVFYNDSTQSCYVKLGLIASSTSFTILMQAASTFIIDTPPLYTGEVDGIWTSANGAMRVTELV